MFRPIKKSPPDFSLIMNNELPDAATTLPPARLTAISEKFAFDAAGKRVPLHANISIGEAVTLYRVVRDLKPKVGAEVGFAQGTSAHAILKAITRASESARHKADDKTVHVSRTAFRSRKGAHFSRRTPEAVAIFPRPQSGGAAQNSFRRA
jgi:hypothetical protein